MGAGLTNLALDHDVTAAGVVGAGGQYGDQRDDSSDYSDDKQDDPNHVEIDALGVEGDRPSQDCADGDQGDG